jgi:integrase
VQRRQTLKQYANNWLKTRRLKPGTRALYRRLLDNLILPELGAVPIDRIAPTTVRNWYHELGDDKPTRRAHAYGLLHAIMATAEADDVISHRNPCRIENGGHSKVQHEVLVVSLTQLEVIASTIHRRYQLMVLLGAWCGLRFGELTELRRGDIDLDEGVIRIRRAVTYVEDAGPPDEDGRPTGAFVVGDPKSDAGKRPVAIPPHLLPFVTGHLEEFTGPGPDALLFPSTSDPTKHLASSTFTRAWRPARDAAGRPDLHFHDLRHTGATLAAATGATLAELMARLGHSTSAAAMRYQHAVSDRDKAIAEALSGFAGGKVIPLKRLG